MTTATNADASGKTEADTLVDFREVYRLTGYKCKTGHTARALAARGLIRAVRLNERTIRYSRTSVLALVAGSASA